MGPADFSSGPMKLPGIGLARLDTLLTLIDLSVPKEGLRTPNLMAYNAFLDLPLILIISLSICTVQQGGGWGSCPPPPCGERVAHRSPLIMAPLSLMKSNKQYGVLAHSLSDLTLLAKLNVCWAVLPCR